MRWITICARASPATQVPFRACILLCWLDYILLSCISTMCLAADKFSSVSSCHEQLLFYSYETKSLLYNSECLIPCWNNVVVFVASKK